MTVAQSSATGTGAIDQGKAAERRRQARRNLIGFLMALPPIIVLVLFVGLPVVLAIAFSFGYTGGLNQVSAQIGQNVHQGSPFTLGAYSDIINDPRFIRDLGVTLLITVVSTLFVLVFTVGIAVYARLTRSKAGTLLTSMAIIPLFIPVVIASWANLTFYSSNGFIRSLFAQFHLEGPTLGFTTTGVIIASIWVNLPFATLMVTSGIEGIPDALIESARDAGASTMRIVWEILIPLAKVPILIASTFTAIGVLGQFTVPYFTGPNAPSMLGVDISKYFQSFNEPQQSVAIAVVIFVFAIGIAVAYIKVSVGSNTKRKPQADSKAANGHSTIAVSSGQPAVANRPQSTRGGAQ